LQNDHTDYTDHLLNCKEAICRAVKEDAKRDLISTGGTAVSGKKPIRQAVSSAGKNTPSLSSKILRFYTIRSIDPIRGDCDEKGEGD
jgi:hypothetical protein